MKLWMSMCYDFTDLHECLATSWFGLVFIGLGGFYDVIGLETVNLIWQHWTPCCVQCTPFILQVRMDRKQDCVKLSVQPSRGLMDEKFIILVQNVPPCCALTVRAFNQCDKGNKWEAYGHYTADATGTMNVAEDFSLGGTYSGIEPMGLLWSLRPVQGSKLGQRLVKKNTQTPMEVTISVYQGHQTEGFMNQVPLACAVVERWYTTPGVRRIPITEEGLDAVLFLPPGPGRFPGVLDLWGAGTIFVEYRSAMLASHGFASLTLNYLKPKVTLETGKMVDNEYFERAYTFLQKHPAVLSDRIAMLGNCFGSNLIVKMACYFEVVKLRCAVCINATHVQPVGGTLEDMVNHLQDRRSKVYLNEEEQVIGRGLLLPIMTDPSTKLDMGRLQCPLLLVVGEDDQTMPSYESAMDMQKMMERAGNSHLLTVLSYPNTGHVIEPPYMPHTRASVLRVPKTNDICMALFGGETVAHCHAQEDAWKNILAFLREHLFTDRKIVSHL
ncbi:acyl-coenzyme A thioesterase 5-like isoform X1 [Solea solea]|uniref:acyl-coenzyme A thioesterase 5-like isoform X1 n=2 Tax=Solea solea TaxID=90069 RepID=UPI00272C50C2|nr:acyl-coenzyme A thioesterase 5-like isoform X1 [Solea solea]